MERIDLKKLIAEAKEIAEALDEFADKLEKIEKKHVKSEKNASEKLNEIIEEIEKLNPVDYGSIYSYESHTGASEMQSDILEIIDKYIESEHK